MKKLNIIWGAPCSGKSTYCKKQMSGQDVVFDFDAIKKALIYGEEHETIDWIRDLVQSLRFSWLRAIKDDENIDDAYMIISSLSDQMKSFIENELELKPEYHLVKSTLAECLERLEKDDNRPDKEVQAEQIKKWFKTYGEKEEKSMVKKLDNRQFRTAQEFDSSDQNIVEGYATTWEPYELYQDSDGPIYERFEKTCFDNADMGDVIMQYDHQGKVVARQTNGTLQLTIDEHGLKVRADLSKSTAAKELNEEIKAGLITKMSWGFRVGDYYYDKKTRTIVHKSVEKVFDVSAVSIPANQGTEINARTFADGVIQQMLTERSEREKLLLQIDILRSKR